MLTRLLIANRGEIAVRIASTAHRLGIGTVGVYSEPDTNSLHVDVVDRAVALGGATPADSYLRAEAVIQAALDTGCDAIHPGYGFLAENADFAQAVIDAGLVWVGPTPTTIRLLGDKIAAKRAAVAAGVPTTEAIELTAGEVAPDVTMPALVKAAAGGGGRGMRIVRTAAELPAAIQAAAREAESSFGDATLFIEPYIEAGRHIEVQIIGDHHDNVLHLGERECSIQRRNQKILEESPSVGIDPATRAAVCEGALALARHVGYTNAGTVEFMVGDDGTITFLEVNTRLQVEHPVTEAVTGLDLVELQLKVAEGQELPIRQADVVIDGHAIEVRVVAEDPAAGWLPSTGAITEFAIGPDARVDTGVRAGAEISSNYDSMIAKVITHAPTRAEAARTLARMLRSSVITGVDTNLGTLARILEEPDFADGTTLTSYLDDHPAVAAHVGLDGPEGQALLLAATFAAVGHAHACNQGTGFAPSGWRNLRTQGQRRTLLHRGEPHHVEYVGDDQRAVVKIGPWPEPTDDGSLSADERVGAAVRLLRQTSGGLAIEIDGVRHLVETTTRPAGDSLAITVRTHQRTEQFLLPATFEVPELAQGGGGPICPLPGTVIAVMVSAGDQVRDGDVLMIVEAMKMEHKITAAIDGRVDRIHFGLGERVDQGDLLVSLDTEG